MPWQPSASPRFISLICLQILEEARSGGKSRPGRRYGAETMLLRPEEEGTGEGLLQGDYNSHHPWGVDDEDMMDGSGSGAAPEHADVAEYADIGAPVWPDGEQCDLRLI
jgi:hypothetical protein